MCNYLMADALSTYNYICALKNEQDAEKGCIHIAWLQVEFL